jgi:hypothetical protein
MSYCPFVGQNWLRFKLQFGLPVYACLWSGAAVPMAMRQGPPLGGQQTLFAE